MTKRERDKAIRAAYVAAAAELYGRDGACEIDSNAKVSVGESPGAYVQAWVWVDASEMIGYLDYEKEQK